MSALSEYVNRWLKREGKGQNELAALAKIRPSTLSHLMNKKEPLPKPATVKKLAGAMGIDASVLTMLLGYPIESTTNPDGRLIELARRLAAFPWLTERIDDLMRLSGDEFQELMDYLAFRQRNRNGGQSTP